MAEVKPDEKKRKNPLLSDKVVEEPTLDDVLSGRKRKSSFEIKDGRNKGAGKDKSSRSSNGGRSNSPEDDSLAGRSEGSGYIYENASIASEDPRRAYYHEDHESIASIKADDSSLIDENTIDRPGSSNSVLIDKQFDDEEASVQDQGNDEPVDVTQNNSNQHVDQDLDGDGDGDNNDPDGDGGNEEESNNRATKKRRKRTSSILKSLEPIHPDEPSAEPTEEDSNLPRYQSHRAAAMVAKTKLSAKGPVGRSNSMDDSAPPVPASADSAEAPQSKNSNISRRRKGGATASASKLNWVQCNKCSKWRTVAAHVNDRELPDEWYCHLNTWDPQLSSCDAPEELEPQATTAAAKARSYQAGLDEAGGEGPEGKGQQRVWVKAGNGGRGRWKRAGDGEGRDSLGGGDGPDGYAAEDGDGEQPPSVPVAAEEPTVGVQSRRRTSQGTGRQAEALPSSSPRIAANTTGTQRQSIGGAAAGAGSAAVSATGAGAAPTGTEPAAVNWVQCNKCRKWRKVPETIDVDSLPEKWFCSLNTWAVAFARCAAKQEPDDPVVPPVNADQAGALGATGGGKGMNRARRQQSGGMAGGANNAFSGMASPILPPGTIKKVSWVQCERRNCKKWRKVPGNIDVDLLPEKWYCEMNTWDGDSATCDAPEASDSENEQPNAAASRQQLILANSKGTNALSYRRIIFGTDGRIRVCFSDKNKNGYGIFSYSEAHKPNNDADDYTAPTRRVGYWWSGAYDESAGAAAALAYAAGLSGNKAASKKLAAAAAVAAMAEIGNNDALTTGGRAEPPAPTYLLDTARRLSGMVPKPGAFSWPKKISKSWTLLSKMPLFRRQALESTAVMSCFMSTPSSQLPFTKLLSLMATSRFADPEVDACREYMSSEGLKGVVKRLEDKGLVEVSYSSTGQLNVDVLTSVAQIAQNCAVRGAVSASVATGIAPAWTKQGLPLKMRKFHANSKYKQEPVSDSITSKFAAMGASHSHTHAASNLAQAATTVAVKAEAESLRDAPKAAPPIVAVAAVATSSYPMKPFRLQHKEKWTIPAVVSSE